MPRTVPRYLLALDLGRVTGVARGPFSALRPFCLHWDLPVADPLDPVGARVAALENTLGPMLDGWLVSHLVMAERFPSRNMGEAAASFALDGIVRSECWRRAIPVLVQPEGTVRKEMLGRGTGPTDLMKSLVMDWCARNEIVVADHNEGDAAVLWRWARDEIARQYGRQFGKRAA